MPHSCIHVEAKRGGQETVIEVNGWPGPSSDRWHAYTPDRQPLTVSRPSTFNPISTALRLARNVPGVSSGREKGRVITACGWHRWKANVAVAELHLHVGGQQPLQIQRFESSDELIDSERYAVRSFLVSCAVDVAEALQTTLEIDHGMVDWRVRKDLAGAVAAASPGFVPLHIKSRRRRPKHAYVILRREP